VAMAGASPRHNRIAGNIYRRLDVALDATACQVWNADQRVRVDETGTYVYPDVSVACGESRFTTERPASLLNPMVVVEVISPSTEDHDRGAKLAHYRRMASVREVLLVETNTRRAELYRRLEDGRWLIIDVTEGDVHVESLDVRLALDEIYAKTEGLPLDPPVVLPRDGERA
jgi:Uma2 family endonuclease